MAPPVGSPPSYESPPPLTTSGKDALIQMMAMKAAHGPKPGYKTTEFWFTAAAAVAPWLAAAVPAPISAAISAAAAAFYGISRGIAKISR
jgi:hypothetical protein